MNVVFGGYRFSSRARTPLVGTQLRTTPDSHKSDPTNGVQITTLPKQSFATNATADGLVPHLDGLTTEFL